MTLESLILVPTLINSQSDGTSDSNISDKDSQTNIIDLEKIKEKVLKIVDTDIIRLNKVKLRINDFQEDHKEDISMKINNMIIFLKEKRAEIHNAYNLNLLKKVSRDIQLRVVENNVNLGKVFDNKKEAKKEKEYSKLERRFAKYEENAKQYAIQVKDNIIKLVHKGRNIIEQMRNEEKKDKDKLETKILRRELANVLNSLNKL